MVARPPPHSLTIYPHCATTDMAFSPNGKALELRWAELLQDGKARQSGAGRRGRWTWIRWTGRRATSIRTFGLVGG